MYEIRRVGEEVTNMFIGLMGVMVPWVYIFVKTFQICHFKYVWFIMSQWSLNKPFKKLSIFFQNYCKIYQKQNKVWSSVMNVSLEGPVTSSSVSVLQELSHLLAAFSSNCLQEWKEKLSTRCWFYSIGTPWGRAGLAYVDLWKKKKETHSSRRQ